MRLIKLRYLRDKAGIIQKDFATLLGVKTAAYSLKERGKVEFRLSEMLKIQKALNKKLGEDLKLDDIFLP